MKTTDRLIKAFEKFNEDLKTFGEQTGEVFVTLMRMPTPPGGWQISNSTKMENSSGLGWKMYIKTGR